MEKVTSRDGMVLGRMVREISVAVGRLKNTEGETTGIPMGLQITSKGGFYGQQCFVDAGIRGPAGT